MKTNGTSTTLLLKFLPLNDEERRAHLSKWWWFTLLENIGEDDDWLLALLRRFVSVDMKAHDEGDENDDANDSDLAWPLLVLWTKKAMDVSFCNE